MREIQLNDAKAQLSAVVDGAVRGEEYVVTRDGHKEAVVASWETWRRLSDLPSFGRPLAAAPLDDADLAERDATPPRDEGLKYLIDTNVISALAPTKAERPAALTDWLDRRSDGSVSGVNFSFAAAERR